MAVRSRRFFGPVTVSTAATTLYTVPSDRTAIIRTITIYNFNAASSTWWLLLNGSTGTSILARGTLATLTSTVFSDELVLDPGDVLSADTTLASSIVMAGFGSLLLGAPV